ncbi:hypothetical protein RJ639_023102 [Escallonia herrerae]|uniref:MADS-box domain-containing protein n=1 Tax=Escallonia herrerae TaxID=1293975 RepID=A0AA88UZX0_9ASTE|nr:hypothetical protein RJ639_023102 [Escallonia herrerae]
MGRKKIEIKKQEDIRQRYVTFSKRRIGVHSKAAELCMRFDAQLAIIMSSPGADPKYYTFSYPSVDAVLDAALTNSSPITEDATKEAISLRYREIKDLEQEIATEKEKLRKKRKDVFWWKHAEPEECKSMEDLKIMINALKKVKDGVASQKIVLDTTRCDHSTSFLTEYSKKNLARDHNNNVLYKDTDNMQPRFENCYQASNQKEGDNYDFPAVVSDEYDLDVLDYLDESMICSEHTRENSVMDSTWDDYSTCIPTDGIQDSLGHELNTTAVHKGDNNMQASCCSFSLQTSKENEGNNINDFDAIVGDKYLDEGTMSAAYTREKTPEVCGLNSVGTLDFGKEGTIDFDPMMKGFEEEIKSWSSIWAEK